MMKTLTAALALGAFLSTAASAQTTDIRFTLGWKTQGSDAAFFLAQEKGYFEDEGLNVTIDQGEGSGATVTRIMSGAYDAGFGDINAIIQNASTRPDEVPLMVYQMWNQPPFAIVSKKEAGIEAPADLAGKTLGGAQGTPTTRLLPVFARTNDVDIDAIAISNMAPNLQEPMLIRDEIDGALVFNITSWFNLLLNRQDPEADFNWLNFGDYGLDLYSNGLMVSQAMIRDNPEAVAGLVRAVNKATVEIGLDQEAAMDATVAYDNLVNRDIEKQRLQFAYSNLMTSDESGRIGVGDVDDERLARSIDIVVEGYELEVTPEVRQVFSREFLPAREERELVYEAN
jgi:NitT/TauT family transport system substrate-binding protein